MFCHTPNEVKKLTHTIYHMSSMSVQVTDYFYFIGDPEDNFSYFIKIHNWNDLQTAAKITWKYLINYNN